jgi:DNA-binding response OmpR family regulator
VRVLLDRQGAPVSRQALVSAIYPGVGEDRHRALDSFVRRARVRLGPLGLEIHTVRGIGYMLEARELPC